VGKKYPYYPRYTGDLAASVDYQLMSFAEMGFYNFLIDMSWEAPEQCMLTPEYLEKLRELKRIRRKTWDKLMQSVQQKFTICEKNGALYNDRLLMELEKMREKSSKNARNGLKGGRPRNRTVVDPALSSQSILDLDLKPDIETEVESESRFSKESGSFRFPKGDSDGE